MLDYALLSALSAVAVQGSFEKAAQVLHVTPSAVSQRIKLLEERVGQVLIVRGQPCKPTEAGALLCAHAEQVVLLEDDLRNKLPLAALWTDTGHDWPKIKVGVNADSVATWMVSTVAGFAAERRVLVDFVIDDQDYTAPLLRTGAVIGAITTADTAVQGCRVVGLGRMRYRAVASPAYLARYLPNGPLGSDLAAAPCLTFNQKDTLQAEFLERLAGEPLTPPSHWLPDSHGFIAACLGGMAWGMVPEMMITTELARGELVDIAPGEYTDVMLYWQCPRLGLPLLEALTAAIVAGGRRYLVNA
jgi:LysR family transcriptional regulator (chromosome initiation inhibitor)